MISDALEFYDPSQSDYQDQSKGQQYQQPVQQSQNFQQNNQFNNFSQQRQVGEYASLIHGGFSWEPSILEELGIHNSDIKNNLRMMLLPNKAQKEVESNFFACTFFFVVYALLLLLMKRPRFGTVYMVTLCGFIVLYFVFSNMRKAYYVASEDQKDSFGLMTIYTPLSYCLPVIFPIVFICRLFGIGLTATLIVAIPFIGWASYCVGRYLSQVARIGSIELLFVPVSVFYAFLLLLPII